MTVPWEVMVISSDLENRQELVHILQRARCRSDQRIEHSRVAFSIEKQPHWARIL